MAINTRAKRQSVLGVMTLPPPDGAIGVADRIHVNGIYGGIAAASPVFLNSFTRYRTFFGTFFGPR